jgi:hypothetical protein
MWRRIIAASVAVLLLASSVPSQKPPPLLVAVKSCTPDGECVGGGGFVWVSSEGTWYILTAGHVLENELCSVSFDWAVFERCSVVWMSKEYDTAVIAVKRGGSLGTPPLAVEPFSVSFGQEVEVWGFPGRGWRAKLLKARLWMVSLSADNPSVLVETEEKFRDLERLGGFSGGPVLWRGRLLGIVTGVSMLPNGRAVIFARPLIAFGGSL